MDTETTIEHLKCLAVAFRDARNWAQFHDPKNLAAGLAIEAAELQELFLWKKPEEIRDLMGKADFRERLGEEMADVAMFLLYLSQGSGIDLSAAIERKISVNERKYPVEKSYNSSTKYDKL